MPITFEHVKHVYSTGTPYQYDALQDINLNITENKIENLNEIVENAYKLAEERDLKNIGKKYRDYYEYILNNAKK